MISKRTLLKALGLAPIVAAFPSLAKAFPSTMAHASAGYVYPIHEAVESGQYCYFGSWKIAPRSDDSLMKIYADGILVYDRDDPEAVTNFDPTVKRFYEQPLAPFGNRIPECVVES